MNFAEIEKTWQSPLNQPSPAEIERMKTQFHADHDRRRRSQKVFLGMVVVFLAYPLIRLADGILRPDPSRPAFDLAHEWGTLILLLLPWIAVVLLARQLSRHDREHGQPGPTLADSVRALLDENRISCARLKIVAGLHGALLLVLPLVVWQLRAVGKAGNEILWPAFVGWPLIALGILLAMRWHYRTKLLPRRQQLEELLKSYE